MKRLFKKILRTDEPEEVPEASAGLQAAAPGKGSDLFSSEPRISSLRELVDLREVQKIQNSLAETSGLCLVLTGPEGYALTRPSNFSSLCRQIRKTDKGRKHCLKSERSLNQKSKGLSGPTLMTCQSAGLQLVVIPVRVREQHLASWLLGQSRPPEMGEAAFRRYGQAIQADPEPFLRAFRALPCRSREELLSLAECVHRMSRFMVEAGLERRRLSSAVSGLERSAWELRRYQEYLEARLEERGCELTKRQRIIEDLTVTDALTECFNRTYLNRHLSVEVTRAKRYGRPLSVCLVRLDDLGLINRQLGEPGGDKALQDLAGILQQETRRGIDWLARYEGGRFALVFPETGLEASRKILERLKRTIERSKCFFGEERLRLRASFGLCTADPVEAGEDLTADRLLDCARTQLERAVQGDEGKLAAAFLS